MKKNAFYKTIHFILIFTLVFSALIFSACSSSKDIEIAQNVICKIDDIGDVTLDKKEYIFEVSSLYDGLTEKQKSLVVNYNILLEAIDKVEIIEIENEILNDPNRNITRDDLLGLWQSNYDVSSAHYWNIWFAQNSIHYIGTKSKDPGFDILKDEYLIATSYSFDEVDKTTRLRKGKFYNSDLHTWFSFTVQIKNDTYQMHISGSPIGKTFYRMS